MFKNVLHIERLRPTIYSKDDTRYVFSLFRGEKDFFDKPDPSKIAVWRDKVWVQAYAIFHRPYVKKKPPDLCILGLGLGSGLYL